MDTRGKSLDRQPPPSTAEISTETKSVQIIDLGTTGPPPRSPRSTAFLVGGVAIALAFGGIVALNRSDLEPAATHSPTNPVAIATSGPSATPPPTPPATTRPTATPRPTPAPWVWDAYDLRGFDTNAVLSRVWGFGNRFVTLVSTPTGDADGTGLHSLLVSTDGSGWSRAVLPAPAFQVEHGTVIDGTLWLVGQASREEGRAREAWATNDGMTWTRATGLESLVADVGAVGGLAWLPTGWAALCARAVDGQDVPVLEVRVETATNVWDTIEVPFAMHEIPVGFAGDQHGMVLLVQHLSDEGDGFFDVRYSSNGGAWTVVETLRSGVDIASVTVGPKGYVIVGEEPFSDDGSRPVGWWSIDGIEWVEATMPVGVLPPGLSRVGAHRVIPTDSGYLAISQPNGMAWISTTGQSWSAFNIWPTANGFMTDVAAAGDRIVAIRDNPGRLGFLRGTLSGMR